VPAKLVSQSILIISTCFSALCLYANDGLDANLNKNYQVCFTPGGNCTQLIVDKLNQAQESIFIQAYSFTSAPIAKAVVNAKARNIPVYVILDKSQSPKNKYSSAKYLLEVRPRSW
jgi:phosphatidylserine/phosphatidylglycerophosphate/cardiolipin synthase-like enzyme